MEVFITCEHEANFDLAYAIQLALLHDTIEDTDTTCDNVKNRFDQEVADGVRALTQDEQIEDKDDRMMDSIKRINDLRVEVGLVKLADRITNFQMPPRHWDQAKREKYHKQAEMMASTLRNKNEYYERRIKKCIENYRRYLNE